MDHDIRRILPWERLTQREKEVVPYIVKGLENKEIANELNISEQTVKNHITSIFKKLDTKNRLQIIYFAIRDGFVKPEPEQRLDWNSLTKRESEIAYWKTMGYSNREIIDNFNLKEQTVKNHMTHVYMKLGITKDEELLYHAMLDGFADYGIFADYDPSLHETILKTGVRKNPLKDEERRLMPGLEWETLTKREKEIILYMAKGLMNKEIADELNISEITVKNRNTRIFKRLGANRLDIVYFAIRDGFVVPDPKERLDWECLTDREYEVVGLKIRGYENREIANNCDITEQAVKNHISSIFKKLDIGTPGELLYHAMCDNIIDY